MSNDCIDGRLQTTSNLTEGEHLAQSKRDQGAATLRWRTLGPKGQAPKPLTPNS